MAVEPDEGQLAEVAAVAGGADDGPVVMLNLNRYRDREAYLRYGAVALAVLERVGGRILWHTDARLTLIGDDSDRYDEAIAVWYPSVAAFMALATAPEILEARKIRAAGLSRPKIAYLRDLAQHVEDGSLELERLPELADEEVSAQLTAIKGLGQWTVDMFLIFHLGRPDILPVGDLGIRRAAQLGYGLDELPKPAELEAIAEPWRPYRSLASLYLWSSLDNAPD